MQGLWRFIVLAALLLAGPATAELSAGDLLATDRWTNAAHGLSLRPPLGARLVESSVDDAIVRIAGSPPYTITVFVRKSEKEVDLARVEQLAIEQMGLLQPSAVIQAQKELTLAGRPALGIIFRIPVEKKPTIAIAQSFMLLDSTTVVMVQLETEHKNLPVVTPIYDEVVQSIEIRDPAVTAKERAAAVERWKQWFEKFDGKKMHAAMSPPQWLRLLEGDKDVGYMLIEQRDDRVMENPGLRVDVQARVVVGSDYYDSISTFFTSDDLATEVWSIRTTVRPQGKKLTDKQEQERSFAETGLRSKGTITITREGPDGKKEFKWEEPAMYVPQAALYLIGPMLPRDAAEMGFYAYYPAAGKIGYRTEKVKTLPKGGFEIRSKPTPDQPEQVSEYDKNGKLVRRALTATRVLVPASPAEVQARWKLK
jgi:hypothetical protein